MQLFLATSNKSAVLLALAGPAEHRADQIMVCSESSGAERDEFAMVIALLELVPQIEKRQAMLEVLRFVEELVRTRPQCLECGVFEATNGTPRVLYMEQWKSTKDLHAHLRSGLYLRILNAVELASEEPIFSFHEVSQTESMELIRELRSSETHR